MKKTDLTIIAGAILVLVRPIAVLADNSGTATLSAGSGFAFDSGTTTGSGDILFTGTSITFQGGAKGFNLGNIGAEYAAINATELPALTAAATAAPISASLLTVGDVFAVLTKGGNAAKVMVSASSSSSISFQYTTYGASATGGGGGGASAPTVADIQNNSSLIPVGFPNAGVAPSTLFVIHGSGLASATTVSALQDSTKGLPTTLNGATVTVTAGGKNYTPALYYAIATQIAGVMPAAVPVGPATLTVNYNSATSASFSFNVVASAYGVDVYNGNTAVATDASSGALLTPTSSGKPGQVIIIWGTGLGSDPKDSDTTYTSSPNAISTPVQVYIGGVQATSVAYSGGSVYPGVHVIGVTIPSGVSTGCYVPITIVTGSSPVVSNSPVIAIENNGGVCSDALYGVTGSQISTLTGKSTVNTGSVIVGQDTNPGTSGTPQTTDIAVANFQSTTGSSYVTTGQVSIGACTVNEILTSSGGTSTTTGLDAGTVTVTGPSGGPVTLQTIPQVVGEYVAQLPAGAIPSSGGTFAFSGTGGSGANSIGPFNTSVNFPNPLLSWTNQSAAASVTRTSGLTFQWTGGAAGSYVIMTGSSSSTSSGVSGSYTCIAPLSAGQFTVPSYVLLALPAGTGNSIVENANAYTTFTANNLDFGISIGFVVTSVNTTWQ